MSTISSGTTLTTALVQTGDTTGDLVIKTGSSNTTAMTISGTDQSVTIAGTLTANGSSITPSQWTSNSTAIYYSTGNVGIGTSSPGAKLSLTSTGNTTADGVRLTFGSEARPHNIYSDLTTGRDLLIAPWRAVTLKAGSGTTEGEVRLQSYESTVISTGSSYTERMRINSSGNVGIGTSNPLSRFTVAGTLRRNVVTNGTSGSPAEEAGLIYEDAGVSTERTGIYFSNAFQSIGNTEIRFKTLLNDVLAECGRFDASGNFRFNSGYGSVATAYGCRAWVNFGGGVTFSAGSIRGSGNISSITVNGTGDYTLNFSTAMPDATYSVVGTVKKGSGQSNQSSSFSFQGYYNAQYTTSAARVVTIDSAGGAPGTCETVSVVVLR